MLPETLNEQQAASGRAGTSQMFLLPCSCLCPFPGGVTVTTNQLPLRPWACAVLLDNFISESSRQQMEWGGVEWGCWFQDSTLFITEFFQVPGIVLQV